MSPRHHPAAEILTAYASGVLAPGFGLVVGAHVEVCAQCAAMVGALEAEAGAALADLAPAALDPGTLARTLARLETPGAAASAPDRRPFLERLPLKPKRWVAPGVWVAAVDTPHACDDRVYVLSVARGMKAARHEHSGAEFCTVLKGAYRDEIGHFRAGDFVAADDAVKHQPIVDVQEACICLFATEGRLRPAGWAGRLVFALADV